MTFYLGIDLGKDGGLALLDPKGDVVHLAKPPLVKGSFVGDKKARDEYDIPAMGALLMDLLGLAGKDGLKVILEKAQPFPRTGVIANFIKGYSAGLWHGLLTALGIPYEIIAPQAWQRVMFRDLPRQDTKQASILVATRLWPQGDFKKPGQSKKPDHGLTDAVLIAEFCRRRDGGAK